MYTSKVELGPRSYPIFIESGLLGKVGEMAATGGVASRYVVITNEIVDRLYGEKVISSLDTAGLEAGKIVIPDGERYKSLETFNRVIGEMIRMKCDRQAAVLALGGGVVGDLAGYVAASYMRGISFLQVPTTLLAQVDASIGGKVGVNHPLGKNMIGAFHQPRLVLIDPEALQTLPERERICGLAEIAKHALIRDREYFVFLETHWEEILGQEAEVLGRTILRSCEIKAEIVGRDEREAGQRALLNFGHTVGHGLEAAGHFEILRHGEAVWIGMLAEAYLSKQLGKLEVPVFERLEKFLHRIPLLPSLEGISTDEIGEFIARDKKVVTGAIRVVMLESIGEAELTTLEEPTCLQEAISYALAAFGK